MPTSPQTIRKPVVLNETIRPAGWKHKLGLLVLFSIAYLIFYVYPNIHPLFEPRELPLLLIDRTAPFLPWTFTVYLSEFVLIAVAVVLIKNLEGFNSFARHVFSLLGIIGPFFYFFPTTYPRPVYPTEENIVIAFAMNLIKNVDAPTNCFPSLHVATTSAAVYSLRFLKPKVWSVFVLWGLAVFASTLTTKQHYLIDILGGIAIMFAVIFLEKIIASRKLKKAENSENRHGFQRR